MIRANCRERFTASDFDFVVRTLARSQTDHVSLVDLLSDAETRDSVLDHPRLVDAILSNAGHLAISSQFYFYVLARHVLRQAGIKDRKLCDYVASLLETFSRISRMQAPHLADERGRQYICDMLIALTRATPEQAFLLRAHVGNYSLFISGIFHENTQRRSQRGGPGHEVLRAGRADELRNGRVACDRAALRAERCLRRTGRTLSRHSARAESALGSAAQPRRRHPSPSILL